MADRSDALPTLPQWFTWMGIRPHGMTLAALEEARKIEEYHARRYARLARTGAKEHEIIKHATIVHALAEVSIFTNSVVDDSGWFLAEHVYRQSRTLIPTDPAEWAEQLFCLHVFQHIPSPQNRRALYITARSLLPTLSLWKDLATRLWTAEGDK